MDRVQDLTIKPGSISSNCHCKTMFHFRNSGASFLEETEGAHFSGLLQFFSLKRGLTELLIEIPKMQ